MPPRSLLACALLTVLLAPPALRAQQDDGPAVIRLQVQQEMLSEWFPDRSGLSPIDEARFEELVRASRQETRARQEAGLLEPMRIEHQARLDGGLLSGTTTLRFPPTGDGVRWAELHPWSPAVDSVSPASSVLVHRDLDGLAFLRLGPDSGSTSGGTRTVELSWTLRPRVEAEGRIFDLELTEGPATALVLDLPEGITPSGPPGYREGPEPTAEPGRHRWRFDGPGGALVLRLRSAPDPDRPAGPWIGGTTVVELDDPASPGPEGAARWSSSWEIDPGPEGHRPLRIALGPGVSWDEVAGPEGAVAGVEAIPGPDGQGVRLLVRWREGLIGPTRLTLSGLATVDDPASWPVPMARPIDAQWTGGPVVVRLGPSWSLLDSRERAGRRLDRSEVSGLLPEPDPTGTVLAFFADRPDPVAELSLAPAAPPGSATVRGVVRLRDGADTLEAEVDLEPMPRSASMLTLELSPGWMPESIRLADGVSAPRWEQDLLPDGRRLLLVHLPGADAGSTAPRLPSLTVSAGVLREEAGSLALPRLRPIGPAIVDERWSILAGPDVTLRPVEAEGLAWLPPDAPAPAPAPAPFGADAGPTAPLPLLSWRWINPEGRGRVVQEHRAPRPSASVDQHATISGGRLTIDWRIRLDDRGAPIRTLGYRIVPDPGDLGAPSWTRSTDRDRDQSGRPLPVSPAGDSTQIRLSGDRAGPVELLGHLELPWDGEGELPMLHLSAPFESRGTVTLRVDPALVAEIDGDFTFRDLGTTPPPAPPPTAGARPPEPSRLAAALMHDGPPGSLRVRTVALPEPPVAGVILRADLQSWASTGDGPSRHRLVLDVAAGGRTDLGLILPPGSRTAAVSCDGLPVTPFLSGEAVRVPLARHEAGAEPASTAAPPAGPPGASHRVVIDYQTPPSGSSVRPDRPRFSVPCLSFCWRLAMPGDRAVESIGPALRPMDPGPPRPGWLPGAHARGFSSARDTERAMLDRLDELAAAAQPVSGMPIGRVLGSWDVGRWPLVVDRSALEALGISPDTLLPSPVGSAPARPDGPRPGFARRVLDRLGLLVVPVDTVLLVTSMAEAPRFSPSPIASGASRASWGRAMREAVAWGADHSDRFQTVERWRSSPTSSRLAAVGSTPDAGPDSEASQVLRLVAPDWPGSGSGSSVRTIDRWPWFVLGGGIGLALILLASVRWPVRGAMPLRVVLMLVLAIGSALAWSKGGPRVNAVAVGTFYGSIVALAVSPFRRAPRADRPDAPGSTVTRSHGTGSMTSAGSAALLLLLTVAALGAAQTLPPSEPGDPIVAFLISPEEDENEAGADAGDENDAAPADRLSAVWLRDTDLERLEAAASGGEPAGSSPRPRVGLTSAEHSMTPLTDGSWQLESRLRLRFEAGGPAVWSLPIDRPTGLEATFDGRDRPVLIGPTDDRASVAIDGLSGPHDLVIRQRVRPEVDGGDLRLSVPVNPVATASLAVSASPGPAEPTLLACRGASTISPDGLLVADLGPVDRIEVSWEAPGLVDAEDAMPRVEGLLLWQALPSADRLDARLTVLDGGPTRDFWFAIEPGVAVRSIRAEGSIVEASRIVSGDGDRWVARIDPPLPDGGVIEIELWRPRADAPAAPPGDVGSSSPAVRPPRLEPIGVERFEGRIALMRPETWGGRLSSSPGDAPISEQEFEQEWGPLPRDTALDPAGAARFVRATTVAVPIGPTPPRRRVTPSLQLDLDAGRWEWRLDAEVVDLDGRPIRRLEVAIPEGLELLDVLADGLTAWDRPDPDRLRLRFDGPASSTRSVSLDGWLPQPCQPMDPGPLVVERPLPWPSWPGVSEQPGALQLSSPATALISYRDAEGNPVPVDRPALPNSRRSYREIRVDRPGTLRLESFPAVTVEIWSQLVVGDRSVRWEALMRYEVVGGPADHVELKLPDAWAEGAEYELEGFGPITVRDLGDRVEIVPGRPIWGVADLRIRSIRPLEPDQPLNFPELVPWGRGTFSRRDALVVPADRPPIVDLSGLEPADPALRDQFNAIFPADVPVDLDRRMYRVRLGDWSLPIRPPSDADAGTDAAEARVALSDVSAVIDLEGSVRGHAAFDLLPSSVPFLVLLAPDGAIPLASVVDGRPVTPRLGSQGRWIIPLGDGPARRVELVWIDPTPDTDSDSGSDASPAPGRRFSIPQPTLDDSAMLITLYCDESHAVSASGGSILPTPAAAPLVERMERSADRIRSAIERDDSSATATATATTTTTTTVAVADLEPDDLAAEVARFLTLQRQAERSSYWAALIRPETSEVVRQRGPLRRIASVRESLQADLAAAGLVDLLTGTSPSADPGPPPEWLSTLRPGLPHLFRAETESSRPISFDWTPDASR